jgi:hypothetical protein
MEYELDISLEMKDLQNLLLQAMKKSIIVHWKQFLKESDKAEEAFYRDQNKTQKKTNHPKKRFNDDCCKCGKQGHTAVDCHSRASASTGGGT